MNVQGREGHSSRGHVMVLVSRALPPIRRSWGAWAGFLFARLLSSSNESEDLTMRWVLLYTTVEL